MADMQKECNVFQGMAVCEGELNKLSTKIAHKPRRGTCYQQDSLFHLTFGRERPIEQEGRSLFNFGPAVDEGVR